jgi:hypothetical protein
VIKKWLQWMPRQSDPLHIREQSVVLESTAVVWRWPFGGGVWNRPTAVTVTTAAGTSRYPIPDRTRQALWTFSGITIAFTLLSFFLWRGK